MRTHTKPLFSDLKLTITDLYRFAVAKLFHRIQYKSLNLCCAETEKMILLDDLQFFIHTTREENSNATTFFLGFKQLKLKVLFSF